MQERFTAQLLRDLSPEAAREIWNHSGHLISEEYLLREGIRQELYTEAAERVLPYAVQCAQNNPLQASFHPQFAIDLWDHVKEDIGDELIPQVDVLFFEYCQALRERPILRLIITPVVIAYFDHFCEALQHSQVKWMTIPAKVAEREGGILKALVLSTPGLKVVESADIYSTVLHAVAARGKAGLPPVTEYCPTDAFSLSSYTRLARWYRETAHSLIVRVPEPKRLDHRQFVADMLDGRDVIRNTDTDWIIEQWSTRRKRKRDAMMCPKCGVYDPRGKHYYRYIAGHGMYSCDLKTRRLPYPWEANDDDTQEEEPVLPSEPGGTMHLELPRLLEEVSMCEGAGSKETGDTDFLDVLPLSGRTNEEDEDNEFV